MNQKEDLRGVGSSGRIEVRGDSLGRRIIVTRRPRRYVVMGADDEISIAGQVLDEYLRKKGSNISTSGGKKLIPRRDAEVLVEVLSGKLPGEKRPFARSALYYVISKRNMGVDAGRLPSFNFMGHEHIGRVGRVGRVGTPNSMWFYRHDIKANSTPDLSPMDPFPVDFALHLGNYLNPPGEGRKL